MSLGGLQTFTDSNARQLSRRLRDSTHYTIGSIAREFHPVRLVFPLYQTSAAFQSSESDRAAPVSVSACPADEVFLPSHWDPPLDKHPRLTSTYKSDFVWFEAAMLWTLLISVMLTQAQCHYA